MTLNTASALKVKDLSLGKSNVVNFPKNNSQYFWQLWKSYEDYFYKCCLNWLGSYADDAEEVMSIVKIKSWQTWQKYGNTIEKPRSWLTRIIYNSCMDVHRKKRREALLIENIDDIKFNDNSGIAAREELPESILLNLEMRGYLQHIISLLPDRLSSPLILYYYHEQPYQEIASCLAISEDNVRTRIKQARSILQKQLHKYLAGEDDTCLDFCLLSRNKEIPMGEEEFPLQQGVICQLNLSIPTNSKEEEISYNVTVLCLETLPYR